MFEKKIWSKFVIATELEIGSNKFLFLKKIYNI